MTYCQKVICCCWLKREGSLEQSKAAWVTCCSRENQATHSASWLCSNASDFYIESRSPLLYKEWKIRILSFNRQSFFSDKWQLITSHIFYVSFVQIATVLSDFTADEFFWSNQLKVISPLSWLVAAYFCLCCCNRPPHSLKCSGLS